MLDGGHCINKTVEVYFCAIHCSNVAVCLIFRELRLTEALHEPHICENILNYNVHAERKGSLRYAKGMSETMQTLHGLVYVSATNEVHIQVLLILNQVSNIIMLERSSALIGRMRVSESMQKVICIE